MENRQREAAMEAGLQEGRKVKILWIQREDGYNVKKQKTGTVRDMSRFVFMVDNGRYKESFPYTDFNGSGYSGRRVVLA